ncbi:MAG: hypothetical protein E4H11_03495 [Myxococcales bacterium]|nr:MAG: hypothetical protein E4H11_03495 [Myxococcales bacterium]
MDRGLQVDPLFRAPVALRELESGASGNASSVSTNGTLAAADDQLYLAAVASKPDVAVSSVSGLGLAWSPVGHQCSGRNQTGVAVWQARGRPSGDGAVTATFPGTFQNAVLAVSRYDNADVLDAAGATSANSVGVAGPCVGGNDQDAYALQLDTTTPGGLLYVATAMRNRAHLPGSGYEERIELNRGSGGSIAGLAMADHRIDAPGPTAVEGRFSSDVDWAAVALEIPASPAASRTTLRQRR